MEEIRKTLEACYVLTPAWHSALNTLEKTEQRLLLIQGASGSGRMLLAEMAACLLVRRKKLKRAQPLVLSASSLRGSEGVGRLKNASAQARREGRLLVLEEAELLSVFPEAHGAQLIKVLEHQEIISALLVYDKMYAALQPVIGALMPGVQLLSLPAMKNAVLPELVREMAEKRWYTLSDQAAQAVLQHAGTMDGCTMGDAHRIVCAALKAQRERCIRQGIPEGSRESRTVIAADVRSAWEQDEPEAQ